MAFSDERLNRIFGKTDKRCAYCHKQLSWSNYGIRGRRGAWEVDHSLPISRGGTDHLNNLVPACVACNLAKGDMTAGEFRLS